MRTTPIGMKQVNVLIDADLYNAVRERSDIARIPMRELFEEALKKYLNLQYAVYTNEDEISGEINALKDAVRGIEEWCRSQGMKDVEVELTPTIKNKVAISRELPGRTGSGKKGYENTCLYCGDTFMTLDGGQLYCSAAHKKKGDKK